ncbi:hypothetical protein FZD51_21160 [Bacillus infantis]|uniref:Uncharacterized protein n=1 Tax=Bacillus infantis TaxID=324767 RepID=A0A5D4R2E6_9BACI|nr:hypothetical protein FZD51_21160 [Bacillus infantis]
MQCPAGNSGRVETPQEHSEEEAQLRPAESEVPGTQINSPPLKRKIDPNAIKYNFRKVYKC